MLISVCMIVRNEEDNIVEALHSIPSDYECIVVDTGSTDRTSLLALECGANVYSYNWCDDFAAARNAASSFATGDYILVLDADERLSNRSEEFINNYVQYHPNEPGAVLIENETSDGIKRHRMVRFFPNLPNYRFVGIVHEQLYDYDQPVSYVPMDLTIYHYGYEETYYHEHQKASRYISLYEKHLAMHPYDGYMLYQFGKLYYSMKDFTQAASYLMKGLEQQERNYLYFPVMLVMLGYVMKEQGHSTEAEHLLGLYAGDYPDFPDIPFLQGILAMDTGKITVIEQSYLKALAIGETTKYSSVVGVGSFKAAYNLGLFYELTGQLAKAKSYYQESAKYQFFPAQERLTILE